MGALRAAAAFLAELVRDERGSFSVSRLQALVSLAAVAAAQFWSLWNGRGLADVPEGLLMWSGVAAAQYAAAKGAWAAGGWRGGGGREGWSGDDPGGAP